MSPTTESLVSLAPIVPQEPPGGPALGSLLGERYRILARIGEGSMGRIYLAEHERMRKRVAVKVLHPELAKVPEMVARFEREAMAVATLDHPHACRATDFGRTSEGVVYLVMDYVEGTVLRAVVERGPLPASRAIDVARQVLSALERAHALGIVHRDLKPENVMLVPEPSGLDFVKLLDFGIARLTPAEHPGQDLTQQGQTYGTPQYMAPEQVRADAVDGRADLYGLGILLYEMLTGKVPFDDESPVKVMSKHLTEPPIPLGALAPDLEIDPRLEAIVMQLLAKSPDARFGSARAVLSALEVFPGRTPAHAEEDDAPTRPGPLRRARTALDAARARMVPVLARGRERAATAWRRTTPRTRAIAGSSLGFVAVLLVGIAVASPSEPAAAAGRARTRAEAPPATHAATAGAPERAAPAPAEAPAPSGSSADLQLAIGLGLAEAGRIPAALTRIEGALSLDAHLRDDPRVASVLVLGLGDRRTTERARMLLRDVLGARAVPHLLEAARSNRWALRRPALDLLEEIAPPGTEPVAAR